MAEVTFSHRAYCKIILHCSKYPHCAVNGILLAANDKNSENGVTYTDAVPLFHLCLQLSPMAEIALSQIEIWAQSAGLVIAGYYLANENDNDTSSDRIVHRIADKIAESFPSCCLVVVDNKLVTLDHETSALQVSQNVDKKWKPLNKSNVAIDDRTLAAASLLLQRKNSEQLMDFDNHLDNIALQWQNKRLNEVIDRVYSEVEDEDED